MIEDSPAVILYDKDGIPMAVADGVAVPANTKGVIFAGHASDGNAYFVHVEPDGSLNVTNRPPQPPAGTTEFVLAGDTPLEVGPSPDFHETESAVIGSGLTLRLQQLVGGAVGDPSEKGSKAEIYWREGAGPTDHLIERMYLVGATVVETLPNTSKARDGTTMTGNGTNTKLVIRRQRMSNSAQEIDVVVRGFTE